MSLSQKDRIAAEITFHKVFQRDGGNFADAVIDTQAELQKQGVPFLRSLKIMKDIFSDVEKMAAGKRPWPDDAPPPPPVVVTKPKKPKATTTTTSATVTQPDEPTVSMPDKPRVGWSIPYALLGQGGATKGPHTGPYKLRNRDHAGDAKKIRASGCNIVQLEYTEWIMTGAFDTPERRAEAERAIAAYDAQGIFFDLIATNANAPLCKAMNAAAVDSLFAWLGKLAVKFPRLIITPIAEGNEAEGLTKLVFAATKKHLKNARWLNSNVKTNDASADAMFKLVCSHQHDAKATPPKFQLKNGQTGFVTSDGGIDIVKAMSNKQTAADLAKRVLATGSAFCAYTFNDDYDWDCVAAVGATAGSLPQQKSQPDGDQLPDALDITGHRSGYKGGVGKRADGSKITRKLTGARIGGGKLTFDKVDRAGWPVVAIKKACDGHAYIFWVEADGKVFGNHFDWLAVGQSVKGLENIHGGILSNKDGTHIPPKGATVYACQTSTDLKERTNVVKCSGTW